MAVKEYAYNNYARLSEHFCVSEFRCKCGRAHNTLIDDALVLKLEALRSKLKCAKIIIISGYRCPYHDRAVGGNGAGMHTTGKAADIVCYDDSGNRISSKLVSCACQDLKFGGIANIDSSYTATHVDVRTSNFWYGNEVLTTAYSVTNDFYKYYNINPPTSRVNNYTELNKELQTVLNKKGANLAVDGVIGKNTLNEVKKYTIELGDSGDLVKCVQKRLIAMGYNCGETDGIAGAKTMTAVNNFQSANKLGVGYLGGTDWNKLLE